MYEILEIMGAAPYKRVVGGKILPRGALSISLSFRWLNKNRYLPLLLSLGLEWKSVSEPVGQLSILV